MLRSVWWRVEGGREGSLGGKKSIQVVVEAGHESEER